MEPSRGILCLVLFLFSLNIAAGDQQILTPEEHRRKPDQTYLTYPEWFLVFSPDEYAEFIETEAPSKFPFIGHICQFWDAYTAVYTAIRNKYPFNSEYHTMIMVIGTSTTVEYAIRYIYEQLFGRLSLITRTHGMTEEDRYAARVARDYVDFILETPWYEFDFFGSLKGLWSDTSLFGKDNLRKWERKYALTTEYSVKALYALVIRELTRMSFEAPRLTTVVRVDGDPGLPAAGYPDFEPMEKYADGSMLLALPRYDPFKEYAAYLAGRDIQFLEIAGNKGDIVISILAPRSFVPEIENIEILMQQPVLTRPGLQRLLISVKIRSLSDILQLVKSNRYILEHVYDF